jgi:hypothetical protein
VILFLFLVVDLREYLGCHQKSLLRFDDQLLPRSVIVMQVIVIPMVTVFMMIFPYRGQWNEYIMVMDLKYFLR